MIATIAICVLSFAVVVQIAALLYTYRKHKQLQESHHFWRLNVLSMEAYIRELETANRRQADSHSAEVAMIARETGRLFLLDEAGGQRHD
jgi:hypothetical protein